MLFLEGSYLAASGHKFRRFWHLEENQGLKAKQGGETMVIEEIQQEQLAAPGEKEPIS